MPAKFDKDYQMALMIGFLAALVAGFLAGLTGGCHIHG